MHNLTNAAPTFDGTEDVDFWLQEIEQYLEGCEVEDEKTMRNVLIGALRNNAHEWFGSLTSSDCNKRDYFSIEEAIKSRYGRTRMQKMRAYEAVKQKPNKTLSQYADRLRKAA